MFLQFSKLIETGYILLLTVAAGGLVGANLAGFVPVIAEFATNAQRATPADVYRSWRHRGWILGAGLFFVGAVVQMVHSKKKDSRENPQKRSRRRWRSSRRKGFGATINGRPCGILGSLGVGTFAGGLLGAMLGGTLLLFWFSLAYSPFAPDGWTSSISVEYIGLERPRNRALTTNHPVALYAFFGPVVIGAVVMGTACGVGTAIQKWKSRSGVDKT